MQQPLLRQDAILEEQQEEPMIDNDAGEFEDTDFTIDSDQIESAIKEQLDNDQKTALNRILEAGNQLLFSKDTHYEVMEGLTDEDDTQLADELGKGGISLAMLLFEKSGGTMPQELIIPAGVVLLARVSEFLKQTGHKINDEIFNDAVMMFQSGLSQSVDPEYGNKIKQAMADGDSMSQQQPQPELGTAMPQQPAGLLGSA